MPQECAPHFLFETSKRKSPRGVSLAPPGQFTFRAAPGTKEKMFGTNAKCNPLFLLTKNIGCCPATEVSPLLLRRAFSSAPSAALCAVALCTRLRAQRFAARSCRGYR